MKKPDIDKDEGLILSVKEHMSEYRRPWKLVTLAIGIGLLIIGSRIYSAPDWDIPVSIIMASFTYLTAGWSMHVIIERRWRDWPVMLLLTWWCIDGCYALYWGIVDPHALELMREANWPASLSLYLGCGLIWFWNGTIRDLFTTLRTWLRSLPFGPVRHFYSVENKTSRQQLREDFGEFPPAPLRCERMAGEFRVVRVRGIGCFYLQYVAQKTLMKTVVSDVHSLSGEFMEVYGNQALALQHSISALGQYSKVAERLLVFLGPGCAFIQTVLAHVCSRKRNIRGYLLPLFKNTSHIVINSARHVQKSDTSTVSHEHIHLLQFRNPENHCRYARSPEKFLSENRAEDPFVHYLLEKNEVEARLHEVVLSFYRAHRHLPMTVPGFFGLLASSVRCQELVTDLLELSQVDFIQYDTYPDRDAMFVEQLEWSWLFIKSNEISFKFISEVLTVMYGNLLRYYGDDAASQSYMAEIERPNFYDELYGEDPA